MANEKSNLKDFICLRAFSGVRFSMRKGQVLALKPGLGKRLTLAGFVEPYGSQKKNLNDLRDEAKRQRDIAEKATRASVEALAEVSRLEGALVDASGVIDGLEKVREALSADRDQFSQAFKAAQEALAKSDARLETSEAERNLAREDLAEVEQKLSAFGASEIEALQASHEALVAELENLKSEMNALEDTIAQRDAEIEDLRGRLAEDDTAALKSEIADLRAQLEGLPPESRSVDGDSPQSDLLSGGEAPEIVTEADEQYPDAE